MRRLPVLHHKEFTYTRLKALVWMANGTLHPAMLEAAGGHLLSTIVKEEQPDSPLILNCQGVSLFDDYALDSVKTVSVTQRRPLILTNATQVEPQIRQGLGPLDASYNLANGVDVMIIGDKTIHPARAERLINLIPELEQQFVQESVASCYRPFEHRFGRLTSTPLLASGIFDARPLISNPERFLWISLLMADKLVKYLDTSSSEDAAEQEAKPKNFKLLAVSLRGSPFAAAVGLLTERQQRIEVVDHMGPKHRILEEHSLRHSEPSGDYVFVGDFIVGGTELRVAQAYVHRKGGALKHAIAIGCLLEPEEYQLDFGMSCLIKLRDARPDATFEFIRD